MKVLDQNAGLLSNSEVLQLLAERGADKQGALSQALPSESRAYAYLVERSAGLLSREKLQAAVEALRGYNLTRAEILQLLNLKPTTAVEIHLVVEDCASFYDVHAILAEETMLPVSFLTGAAGLGRALDPSSDDKNLKQGSKVDIPLWMVPVLAQRNMLRVRVPRFYGEKMRVKMQLGAGCEDLRIRCPYFYDVGCTLSMITHHDALAPFLNSTFRNRYKELLVKAHSTDTGPTITKMQARLCTEENLLFQAGRTSVDVFERWRYSGGSDAHKLQGNKRRHDGQNISSTVPAGAVQPTVGKSTGR
ncbi:hypothetical protein WJX72_008713 [[Myrmecia] bisecta]|uniref:RNA polymerase Rpb4/RPC9 core domain-containing protein n=1 Tax=[Myrmecia] bisecta TaxID=41462 RepID=A0AAW1QFQ6_9CHLO